jgi:TIR domain-containing protein
VVASYGDPMPKVFVSYRREDSAAHAGRLYDRLVGEFGDQNVLDATDNIAPGEDFVDHTREAVARSDVMLVLIGPQWFSTTDRSGKRRIDDPHDFVRLEIATALQRGIPVIPVLVGDADFPPSDFFPEEIRGVVNYQAFQLTNNRWADDVRRLIELLKQRFLSDAGRARNVASAQKAQPPSQFTSGPASTPGVANSRQATTSSDSSSLDEVDRRDIFISYVEEDGATASELAKELRAQQQSTWTYEEDGVPGVSYLTQVFQAIDSCRAVVLIASATSVRARQVIKEVEAAHERDKMLIAVRIGMTHQELTAANPILRMAIGTSVTLPLDQKNVAGTAKRIASASRLAGRTGKP